MSMAFYEPCRGWQPEAVVVTRHVQAPVEEIARQFVDPAIVPEHLVLDEGELELPVPDRVINNNGANARGRLTHCGPQLAPFPPIDITFTAWCPGSSELRLTHRPGEPTAGAPAVNTGTSRSRTQPPMNSSHSPQRRGRANSSGSVWGSRPELPLRVCRRAGGRIGRLCRTRLVRPLGL